MEDEELNEEVLGDVDNPPAEGAPQEGAEEPSRVDKRIEELEERIEELQSSIATIIEAGATIMEPANTDEDSEDDSEPYLYLEDLDYRM